MNMLLMPPGDRLRLLSPLLLLALAVGIGAEPARSQQSPQSLIASGPLDSALAPLDDAARRLLKLTDAPGASLAVAYDGRLVLARGYGYTDVETREPVAPTSRFRIASVTKPITATAVMKLVEANRLSLDARVVTLLDMAPSELSDPRVNEITVRDLLYHAGGWDRAKGFDPPFAADRIAVAMNERPPASADMMVRFMLAQQLDFAPGSQQVYSNIGYAALGRVIEAVTGQSYSAYVRSAVLIPAGAPTIELGRSLPEHRAPDEVRYHDDRRFLSMFPGRGMVPVAYGAFAIETMDAHGGWIASAPDLLRFITHVDMDPTVPDILERETIEAMISPHETAANPDTFYGMGWEIMHVGEGTVWFHRGDLPGTTAMLARAGRTEFAFLLNGNAGSRENAEAILPTLLEAARKVEDWPRYDLFTTMR